MRTTEQKRCKNIISGKMSLLKITRAVLKNRFLFIRKIFLLLLLIILLSCSNRCLEHTIAVLPITNLVGYLYGLIDSCTYLNLTVL